MTTRIPRRGDLCWSQGTVKHHYGICTGPGPDGQSWFIHATIDEGVIHTTRKGFAGNRDIVVELPAKPEMAEQIVAAAKDSLGKPYRLFVENCEHVAREAATGCRESKQLQAGVTATSILTLLALVVANQNGTHVDGQGYRRDRQGRFASRRWV